MGKIDRHNLAPEMTLGSENASSNYCLLGMAAEPWSSTERMQSRELGSFYHI
jgi:hypothetical protein